MPTLSCNLVTKQFGGVVALRNVTASFMEGSVTALIGPNGAGKTTFINVLSGSTAPDAGRITYGDADLQDKSAYVVARMGIVRTFQEPRALGGLTVIEQLLLAFPGQSGEQPWRALIPRLYIRQEAQNAATALKILERLGLSECASVRTVEISYGQQRLLGIACCVAARATVLLLDEPTSGMHPATQGQIAGLIRELADAGCTIIFSEHNLQFVRETAQEMMVFDRGEVIASGIPEIVLSEDRILDAYVK